MLSPLDEIHDVLARIEQDLEDLPNYLNQPAS